MVNKMEKKIQKRTLGVNANEEKIKLTEEGLSKKEERLRFLIDIERPRVLEELSEARKQGDLSENADYDAAKNKQAEVESEIMGIEDLLTRIEIVSSNKNSKKISIGSTVTYKNLLTKKDLIVKIVGSVEFDIMGSEILKIGSNSPIASVLIAKKVGDVCEVNTSFKNYKIEVKKIENS